MILSAVNRKQVVEMVSQLLADHAADADRAYLKGEGKLSISLSVKLKGDVADVGISFNVGTIKDGGKVILGQMDLVENE